MQFKPKRAHYTLLLPALALTLAACGNDIQAMTDGSSSGTTTGTTEIDPTRLCLYDGRGGRTELRLPFDGGPVAFK